MNITQKHRYALSTMVELALNYQTGPIQLRVVSDLADIPHSYLEQLVLDLKRVGLVKSTRGSKGGYQLSKSVNEITVNDIFSAIEPIKCDVVESDRLAFFWNDLNRELNEFLNLSLDYLLNNVIRQGKVLTYSI